jgi:hypothetical protein
MTMLDRNALRGSLETLLAARREVLAEGDAQLGRRLAGEAPADDEAQDQSLAALHRELDAAVRAVTAALKVDAQLEAVKARLGGQLEP